MTTDRSIGSIRPVTTVRHPMLSGGKVLGHFNSDLIFLAGVPIEDPRFPSQSTVTRGERRPATVKLISKRGGSFWQRVLGC